MGDGGHRDGKYGGNRKLLRPSSTLMFLLEEGKAAHRDLVRREGEENPFQSFGEDVCAGVRRAHAPNELDCIRGG